MPYEFKTGVTTATMKTYIALLRGINVSGQKKIKMADLTEMMRLLGLQQIQTYIQSGNIVFSTTESDQQDLARSIEEAIATTFGFEVCVLVKTQRQLKEIVEENPFKDPDDLAANRIYYVFLKQRPKEALVKSLEQENYPNEKYWVAKDCIYLACMNGYGKAKLNNNLFERKLQVVATTRNHKTMMKLLEMFLTTE